MAPCCRFFISTGYKIANPTVLGRMQDEELVSLFHGYGYETFVVAGSQPAAMHQRMAAVLDKVIDRKSPRWLQPVTDG